MWSHSCSVAEVPGKLFCLWENLKFALKHTLLVCICALYSCLNVVMSKWCTLWWSALLLRPSTKVRHSNLFARFTAGSDQFLRHILYISHVNLYANIIYFYFSVWCICGCGNDSNISLSLVFFFLFALFMTQCCFFKHLMSALNLLNYSTYTNRVVIYYPLYLLNCGWAAVVAVSLLPDFMLKQAKLVPVQSLYWSPWRQTVIDLPVLW